MSLLEQNITEKRRVDKVVKQMKFDIRDDISKKYEEEAIWDNAVYVRELESGHLPDLYYLIFLKRYPKEENIWKPTSAM